MIKRANISCRIKSTFFAWKFVNPIVYFNSRKERSIPHRNLHSFLISSIGKSFSFKFVMIHSIVWGCNAEGHVSSVFSERMSSWPMGWSETGSDRMCRLRCFIRNYGREKVIDLVSQRKRYTEKQREVQRYAEALHGSLSGTSTVRKILAIREQIGIYNLVKKKSQLYDWENKSKVISS